jgi:hypothetical protein
LIPCGNFKKVPNPVRKGDHSPNNINILRYIDSKYSIAFSCATHPHQKIDNTHQSYYVFVKDWHKAIHNVLHLPKKTITLISTSKAASTAQHFSDA